MARHLSDTLDETGAEQIETLILHEYVEGKNHGKREQGGMEPQLEELRHRYYEYLRDCHSRLLDRFDEDAMQRVYIRCKKQGLEPHIEFVFSDKSAFDAVRFLHFFSDCRRIAGDVNELAVVIEQKKGGGRISAGKVLGHTAELRSLGGAAPEKKKDRFGR